MPWNISSSCGRIDGNFVIFHYIYNKYSGVEKLRRIRQCVHSARRQATSLQKKWRCNGLVLQDGKKENDYYIKSYVTNLPYSMRRMIFSICPKRGRIEILGMRSVQKTFLTCIPLKGKIRKGRWGPFLFTMTMPWMIIKKRTATHKLQRKRAREEGVRTPQVSTTLRCASCDPMMLACTMASPTSAKMVPTNPLR